MLRYGRVLYYADAMQSDATRAIHLHIGNLLPSMDPMSNRGAGFALKMWIHPQAVTDREDYADSIEIPTSGTEIGYDMFMPIWTSGWDVAEGMADTIYSRMYSKHSWCGPYRWKNYVVENINAG